MKKSLPLIIVTFLIPLLLTSCFSFDDGPFPGKEIDGIVSSGDISYSLDYKGGTLEIYNRSDEDYPLVRYSRSGDSGWYVELRTDIKDYEQTMFWKIEDPVIEKGGLFYDELVFTAHWTYGAELGRARITPRGFRNFYLSW